jgi:hypothetical protein
VVSQGSEFDYVGTHTFGGSWSGWSPAGIRLGCVCVVSMLALSIHCINVGLLTNFTLFVAGVCGVYLLRVCCVDCLRMAVFKQGCMCVVVYLAH